MPYRPEKALRENLTQYLHDAELTQAEFARLCGIDGTALNKMIHGSRSNPELATLLKIAKTMGMTVPELLTPLGQAPAVGRHPLTVDRRRPRGYSCPHCGQDLIVTIMNGRRKAKPVSDGAPLPEPMESSDY